MLLYEASIWSVKLVERQAAQSAQAATGAAKTEANPAE
jgi:Sec-independent protein secretion pathway component TatC